jgi:hypothetical protein
MKTTRFRLNNKTHVIFVDISFPLSNHQPKRIILEGRG